MTTIEGLLIFFSLIFIYFVIVFYLKNKGILDRLNISLYGPALLFRTNRGKSFLRKISSFNRFWKAYGSFGIAFCLIMMIIMSFILVWQTWMIIGFTPEQKAALPGPEIALVLPGINPILPLEYIGYIVFALAIAIIVHEFSHGILSILAKVKVKSLGLLYLIVPIGAFVEPDEQHLKKISTSKRMRVFASGPLSNFALAIICMLLFSLIFMSAVEPAAEGVVIVSVSENSPAENSGFEPGMIIISINNTKINDLVDFKNAIDRTKADQHVDVLYYWHGIKNNTVIFSDKYEEYEKRFPIANNITYKQKGYFGIGPIPVDYYLPVLKNPFRDFDYMLILYVLPLIGYFQGYNPIVAPFTDSYIINGPLGFIPQELFWVMVNTLYWMFWLNLAVGLFNVLPMIPLDGGFLFNDMVSVIIKKFKYNISDERKEEIVRKVSTAVSLLILISIISPFIIKYI
jgi:membrane-associated protease RseP (regulator of RpoE activity)